MPVITHTPARKRAALYGDQSQGDCREAEECVRQAGFHVLNLPDHGSPFCTLACLRNVGQGELGALSRECRELEETIRELTQQLNSERGRADRAEQALELDPERLGYYREALRSIGKQELKAQVDLEELRERYKTVAAQAQQQHALLWQLRQKIVAIHTYLRALEAEQSISSGSGQDTADERGPRTPGPGE